MSDDPPFVPFPRVETTATQSGGGVADHGFGPASPPPPAGQSLQAAPLPSPSPPPSGSVSGATTSWAAGLGVMVGSVLLGLAAGVLAAAATFIVVLWVHEGGSEASNLGEGAGEALGMVIVATFWALLVGVATAVGATAASAVLILRWRAGGSGRS